MSKTPLSAIVTFIPISSSSGVPIISIFAFIYSSLSLSARAASTDIAALAECPQACPTSGRASYSVNIAIFIFEFSFFITSPKNEVSISENFSLVVI